MVTERGWYQLRQAAVILVCIKAIWSEDQLGVGVSTKILKGSLRFIPVGRQPPIGKL